MELDPVKVEAMFARHFGPKLGRFIAFGLISVCVVALFCFAGSVIYENGGKQLYVVISQAVSGMYLPAAYPNIDALVAGLVVALVLFMVFGLCFVLVLYLLGKHFLGRRIPQSVLDDLAELRSQAIRDVLNATVRTQAELVTWISAEDTWRSAVLAALRRHFPRAEVLGFERLGILPPVMLGTELNDQHRHRMMMFAKRLTILEDIIRRYSS